MVRVAPSILSVDRDEMDSAVQIVSASGADFIHIDVMDGKFVSNTTDGVFMFKSAYMNSVLPLDVHLMVENPRIVIEDYLQASSITFHIESVSSIHEAKEIIDFLHEHNIRAGVAIKPDTDIGVIKELLSSVDQVIVMTVEPGYGGQKLMPECLEKVKEIRNLEPNLEIEVDGGVNLENAAMVRESGASIIVVGTAFFQSKDKSEAVLIVRG
ncbi:MAG: ribulose-phosphate 3-epimerase [Clostridia bacterium]|nr:ribulose-phosphate 3-epimerase [Clostridia bacterium]